VIDNKVKKFKLIGSKPATFQEFSEGALGGLPVERPLNNIVARKSNRNSAVEDLNKKK